MTRNIKEFFKKDFIESNEYLQFLKYLGPGLLVTVGFIDPGNWASNVAAGSMYGYQLLWMVTLSTLMLIMLQHNAAHLGIATGLCLSEAASIYLPRWISTFVLSSAVIASISTALAEILGAAIALKMLFGLPLKIGATLSAILIMYFLYTNSYKKIEKVIIGFVSLIGIAFLIQLLLVNVNYTEVAIGAVLPKFPLGSLPIIMSVLGAVVMPHNLFLHSEIIQSRQWNLKEDKVIQRQLKFEFTDTLFSMIVGWAINSAMIIVAAAVFFNNKITVTTLEQAKLILEPLVGNFSSLLFALSLLFAGIASSITAGMAGGSIFAGIFKEPYDIKDKHTKVGVGITIILGLVVIFFVEDPFIGLIYSQVLLSMQLPITLFLQIYLTSSKKVMGKYSNSISDNILLYLIAGIVTLLNIFLILSFVGINVV
ncbi:MAG: Nramp family divalent metal transporter [Candidatus Kapaibacteriota bacterium]